MDELEIANVLNKVGRVHIIKKSKNILVYTVGNIKVDFVNYRYKWLTDPLIENEIKLASMQDIGAMKLNAIAGRGSKKDFVDLYFLLERFSLKELIDFYKEKYPDGSEFLVLKSLSYFEDADSQEIINTNYMHSRNRTMEKQGHKGKNPSHATLAAKKCSV